MDKKIYLFSDGDAAQQQVGGKGYSLIKMSSGGFPVPAGMADLATRGDFAPRFLDTFLFEG